MEILVVAHQYPPSTGGMQKQCFELVSHLEKQFKLEKVIYQSVGSKLSFYLSAGKKVLNILKRNKNVKLIYINDLIMLLFLTPVLKKIKQPIVVTVHGLDAVYPNYFYQRWLKKVLKRLAGVIPVSFQTGDELFERGMEKDKIFPVKNGVELNQSMHFDQKEVAETFKKFGLDQYEKIILSVGRPVKRKGFSWFARNVVPNLDSKTAYVIVGPKLKNPGLNKFLLNVPVLKHVIQRIFLLGIPTDDINIRDLQKKHSNIIRLSNLSYNELQLMLQYSDLFVMPNLKIHGDYEGFGLVTLEASSSGTLCLASKVDGIPSAIEDGKNGELLESANSKQWNNRVKEVLAKDKLRGELAQKFKDYTVEHCSSWEAMSNEYIKVFKQLV